MTDLTEIIEALDGYGWFDVADNIKEQMTAAITKRYGFLKSAQVKFDSFDNELVCNVITFDTDTEDFVDEDMYEELLLDLAKASYGTFDPKNINVEWNDDDQIEISFSMNGIDYQGTAEDCDGWLSYVEILELINKALSMLVVPMAIVSVCEEDGGQELSCAIAPVAALSKMIAAGKLETDTPISEKK